VKALGSFSVGAMQQHRAIDLVGNDHRGASRIQGGQEINSPCAVASWWASDAPSIGRGPAPRLGTAVERLRWRRAAFARFLDDGRIYLSNNAAQRVPRGVARNVQKVDDDRAEGRPAPDAHAPSASSSRASRANGGLWSDQRCKCFNLSKKRNGNLAAV
jgi:hypothetical protein